MEGYVGYTDNNTDFFYNNATADFYENHTASDKNGSHDTHKIF